MAASLATQYYQLGKYAPNDLTDYLTTYNGTMDKIDTAIHAAQDAADTAQAQADANLNNINALSQNLTTANKNIENLGKTQTAQGVEIDNLKESVNNITIGEFADYIFTSVHSTAANVSGRFRTIGKGVQGSIIGYIDAGTYTPDANVENTNVLNVARIAGNVFGLDNMKRQTVLGLTLANDRIVDGAKYLCIYYNSATNYTYFALIIGESTSFAQQVGAIATF